MGVTTATLYEQLGVDSTADAPVLKAAYRTQAKRYHPDRNGEFAQEKMAELNQAWTVLSDPETRAAYDLTLDLRDNTSLPFRVTTSAYSPTTPRFGRKEQWLAGLRVQVVRHTREAVTSAALALALKRHGRPRALYDAQLDPVIAAVRKDTGGRVNFARAAGTAPLDLGLATALVGVTTMARETLTESRITGPSGRHEILAELLDKTWDNLAHGISHDIEQALGGNPRLARTITRR